MSEESALFLSQVPNQVLTTIILFAAFALVWRMFKIQRDTADPFSECGCVHLQGNSQFEPCPMELPLESVSHVGQWIQALQERHWVCTTRCKHRAGCYVIEEIVEFSAPVGCEDWELNDGWYRENRKVEAICRVKRRQKRPLVQSKFKMPHLPGKIEAAP